MSDKIAEIRWRHEAGPQGKLPISGYVEVEKDRGILLREVDRLRSEVERLRAEIDWLTRERDEARANSERLRERNRQAQNAVGSIVAALDGEL